MVKVLTDALADGEISNEESEVIKTLLKNL